MQRFHDESDAALVVVMALLPLGKLEHLELLCIEHLTA